MCATECSKHLLFPCCRCATEYKKAFCFLLSFIPCFCTTISSRPRYDNLRSTLIFVCSLRTAIMQFLIYRILSWLSQLALVATPILTSLPFDLIRDLSAAADVVKLLSGATSLPLYPIADNIPVMNFHNFWDVRSDWLESWSFQIAFPPIMTATGLTAVSLISFLLVPCFGFSHWHYADDEFFGRP